MIVMARFWWWQHGDDGASPSHRGDSSRKKIVAMAALAPVVPMMAKEVNDAGGSSGKVSGSVNGGGGTWDRASVRLPDRQLGSNNSIADNLMVLGVVN